MEEKKDYKIGDIPVLGKTVRYVVAPAIGVFASSLVYVGMGLTSIVEMARGHNSQENRERESKGLQLKLKKLPFLG